MVRRNAFAVLGFLSCVLTACASSGDPVGPSTVAPSLKGGVSGGGGGGGGGTTGGGAPLVGKIRRASGAASCDQGTSIGVTIRDGIQNRAEIQMAISGPADGPVAPLGASLAWTFTIVDAESGARLLAYGTSGQFRGVSALVTISGATTTPGVHTFTFLAENHILTGPTDFAGMLAAPAAERCTATITVTAT